MNAWLTNHCDGAGPHFSGTSLSREVRSYPLGGGANLILCAACWGRENRYRAERASETGSPENWPQQDYNEAKVYATEAGGVQ